jgi:hypothetical protein
MSPASALLEVYYHLAKLQKAVKNNDGPAIQEHSADVANMAMMVLDVCGGLAVVETAAAPQAAQAGEPRVAAFQIPESWVNRGGQVVAPGQLLAAVAAHAEQSVPIVHRLFNDAPSVGDGVAAGQWMQTAAQYLMALASPQAERPALPDRVGVYAWSNDSSNALVVVNKRPSSHSPGGVFNGHVIDSTKFYDGCPVGQHYHRRHRQGGVMENVICECCYVVNGWIRHCNCEGGPTRTDSHNPFGLAEPWIDKSMGRNERDGASTTTPEGS